MPIASKDYVCEACEWLNNYPDVVAEMTFREKRSVVRARKVGWLIKKGERYIRDRGILDGEFYTFRARPDINNLCHKYEVYQL